MSTGQMSAFDLFGIKGFVEDFLGFDETTLDLEEEPPGEIRTLLKSFFGVER